MLKETIFLFSLPRSGSTLLQRLLAADGRIATVSECWFLLPLVFMKKDGGQFSIFGSVESGMAIRDFINELPREEASFDKVIREAAMALYNLAAYDKASYFLDKTPRYYLIVPEIAKMFPNAKLIFLFRNPLGIMASIANSWNKGHFRFHRNYIDLFEGPELLAKGYNLVKDRSIALRYEDLVAEPENILRDVFEYLGLGFDKRILQKFGEVNLRGRVGDKGRLSKAKEIDRRNVERWKETFNTRYRVRFAKRYLRTLEADTISMMGYDAEKLLRDLLSVRKFTKSSLGDVKDVLVSTMIRTFELLLFREKFRAHKSSYGRLYLHF